jgi:hypothetical protein
MKIHWKTDVHNVPTPYFEFDVLEREAVLYALGWSLDSKSVHQETTEKVFKTLSEIDAAVKAMAKVARQ